MDRLLWKDRLELLGTLTLPIVVVVVGAMFSAQQSRTQTEVEEQRAQDEATQRYLAPMSQLLLAEDLRNYEEDSEVRTLVDSHHYLRSSLAGSCIWLPMIAATMASKICHAS